MADRSQSNKKRSFLHHFVINYLLVRYMALRPHFYGFSLKEMVSLIGSKDEKKLSELTKKYNELFPISVDLELLDEKYKNWYL